jgi:hypothetical protein
MYNTETLLVQPLLQCKSNKQYIFWVYACNLKHPACNAHIILSSVVCPAPQLLSTLSCAAVKTSTYSRTRHIDISVKITQYTSAITGFTPILPPLPTFEERNLQLCHHSFWGTLLRTTQIGYFGLSEQNYGFGKVREPSEEILATWYVIRYYNCVVCVHAVGLLHSVIWVASIMLTNDPFSVIVFFMFVIFCVCEIKLLLLTKFHMCCVPLSTSSIKAVAQYHKRQDFRKIRHSI